MGKLKSKIFLVIFLMLTLFLISILCIMNYQNYDMQVENIKKAMFRMDEGKNRINNDIQNKIIPIDSSEDIQPKIFMDSSIYTVKLDEENNIEKIINHTPDNISEEKIKQIANEIIKNKGIEDFKIGNLIFDKYSYLFTKNSQSLIIMDNTNNKNIVIQALKTSLVIFILLEIIIIYISKILTKWIIKPVIETFDKQKQFITDASHELKTPLAIITASAEAMENNPNEKKWLDNIMSESERMNNLITELLEMAKSENSHKEQYEEENLSKIIERGIITFEGLIFEKKINLEYDLQENIFLLCNSIQIKQLISILIDNAIKHSTGELCIKLKKEKGNIIFTVTNTGKEIPKEERENIFERFYRVDESRNRNDNRYGLGLAIAKNIVTSHNGTIQVICENGYTTFKVIIK